MKRQGLPCLPPMPVFVFDNFIFFGARAPGLDSGSRTLWVPKSQSLPRLFKIKRNPPVSTPDRRNSRECSCLHLEKTVFIGNVAWPVTPPPPWAPPKRDWSSEPVWILVKRMVPGKNAGWNESDLIFARRYVIEVPKSLDPRASLE